MSHSNLQIMRAGQALTISLIFIGFSFYVMQRWKTLQAQILIS